MVLWQHRTDVDLQRKSQVGLTWGGGEGQPRHARTPRIVTRIRMLHQPQNTTRQPFLSGARFQERQNIQLEPEKTSPEWHKLYRRPLIQALSATSSVQKERGTREPCLDSLQYVERVLSESL